MFVGGLLAAFENIRPRWLEEELRHSIIAFGGGALISAIALVLVPEGCRHLSPLPVAFWFTLGGICFMGLDVLLARIHSPAGQLMAMLADFIPEAMALGAAFATGENTGPLLALLIGIQNLPEGFNAFRELTWAGTHKITAGGCEHDMVAHEKCEHGAQSSPSETPSTTTGRTRWSLLGIFALMSLLGPAAALIGLFVLAGSPTVIAAIMLFAAGGILYLTFADIAPEAKLEQHWAPPLGAVAGFLTGLIGQMILTAP